MESYVWGSKCSNHMRLSKIVTQRTTEVASKVLRSSLSLNRESLQTYQVHVDHCPFSVFMFCVIVFVPQNPPRAHRAVFWASKYLDVLHECICLASKVCTCQQGLWRDGGRGNLKRNKLRPELRKEMISWRIHDKKFRGSIQIG